MGMFNMEGRRNPGAANLIWLILVAGILVIVGWAAFSAVTTIRLVREKLIRRLERLVDPHIREHIVWERDYRPTDWQHDVNAVLGTAFGSVSHGFFQSSYFRPHNKSRHIAGD